MAGGIEVSGLGDFAASIERLKAQVDVASRTAVVQGAHLIEAMAKPETPVRSGRLRRSIQVIDTTSLGAGIWQARVAPTTVYGRRIELGFHGTDSLNRHYNQSGNPYFQRGTNRALGAMPQVFEAAWQSAME